MAEANVGKGSLVLTANATGLDAGLQAASARIKQWAGTIQGAFTGMVAGLGLEHVFDGIMDNAAKHIKAGRQAMAMGVESSQWEGFLHQGAKFNLQADDIQKAFLKIQRSAFEAGNGNKEMSKTFEMLGLDAKEIVNLAPDKAFLKVSDAIKKFGNVGQQSEVATALLGKQFQALFPLLMKGGAGIQAQNDKLRALGVTIKQNDMNRLIQDSIRIREAQEKWKGSMEGLKNAFTISIYPMIADLASLASKVIDKVIPAFRFMGDVFRESGPYLESILKGIGEEIVSISNELFDFGNDSVDVAGVVAKSFQYMGGVLNNFMQDVRKVRISLYGLGQDTAEWLEKRGRANSLKNFADDMQLMKEMFREAGAVQQEYAKTAFIAVDAWMEKIRKRREEAKKDLDAIKQTQLDMNNSNKWIGVGAMQKDSADLLKLQAEWKFDAGKDDKANPQKQLDAINAVRASVDAVVDAIKGTVMLGAI